MAHARHVFAAGSIKQNLPQERAPVIFQKGIALGARLTVEEARLSSPTEGQPTRTVPVRASVLVQGIPNGLQQVVGRARFWQKMTVRAPNEIRVATEHLTAITAGEDDLQ